VSSSTRQPFRAAATRIANLRAGIQRSRHYWLYDIAESKRVLKVILQMDLVQKPCSLRSGDARVACSRVGVRVGPDERYRRVVAE
jgi:hypothetical protein